MLQKDLHHIPHTIQEPIPAHLSWIELDKQALWHNAHMYKKTVDNKTIAFVIKANAYGHGMQEIALLCQNIADIDWLCTFTLSEAVALRTLGVTKPILVLGPLDIPITHALNMHIDVVVDTVEQAQNLNILAKKERTRLGVHIKIDTGLSRRGVAPEKAVDLILFLTNLPYLSLNGICTHLVESHKEDASFTLYQLKQFSSIMHTIQQHGISVAYIHATNTAGTTVFSHEEYNFFRIGIGLYGLLPSPTIREKTQLRYPDFHLKPVLQWKTVLVQTKEIPAHAYVSYDRTYQTYRPTRIGLLPIGYSDGYDIRLSNRGLVYIKGSYAPILGRVAMNMTTIDLTAIPQAREGDEVTLIGPQTEIRADVIAHYTQCVNVRELLTGIKSHIPRIVL
jgi:alanine racemase